MAVGAPGSSRRATVTSTPTGVSPLVTGGVFGGRAEGFVAGLNWYPTNNLTFQLNYIHDNVNKIPQTTAGGTTSGGVSIDAVAMRAKVFF